MEQNNKQKEKNLNRVWKAFSIVFALAVWEVVALCVHQKILLVTPIDVCKRLLTIWRDQNFWPSICFSFSHIVLGFLLGLLLGITLAILAKRWRAMETILWPWMAAIKSVPVASFVVICLIWLSPRNLSVLISFLIVLPVIYQNTLEGLKHKRKDLIEMATVFRVPFTKRFKYIDLPQLRSYLLSACKTTCGMAWKAGIAAEIIGIPSGSIGKMLYLSKVYLDTDDLLAWTVILVLLSVIFEKVFLYVLKLLLSGRVTGVDIHQELNPVEIACNSQITVLLENVTKAYDNNTVLNQINLEFSPGSNYAVMSPSGTGKTTLLRLLAGLESPDSGRITGLPDSLSIVFQEDRLCEDATVFENILIFEKNRKNREKEALWHLAQVGLLENANQKISTLSGGMKRRVSLVRAMLADQELVLLDEAFNGLDDELKLQVISYVKNITETRTVLFVTHDEEEAKLLGCQLLTL